MNRYAPSRCDRCHGTGTTHSSGVYMLTDDEREKLIKNHPCPECKGKGWK